MAGVAALVLIVVDADHERPLDRDVAVAEVAEAEGGQLAAPGAGLGLQCDERQQLVILPERSIEEPAHVVGRRWAYLRDVVPAGMGSLCRVVRPPAPDHGLAQGKPDDAVDARHR